MTAKQESESHLDAIAEGLENSDNDDWDESGSDDSAKPDGASSDDSDAAGSDNSSDETTEDVQGRFNASSEKYPRNTYYDGEEIEIHPDYILRWEGGNRQDFELGNIEHLAESIKNEGQLSPVLVIPSIEKGDHFELIAGWRRTLACKHLNQNVVAKVFTSRDSLGLLWMQISENEERKGLSCRTKGYDLKRLKKASGLSAPKLASRLDMSEPSLK